MNESPMLGLPVTLSVAVPGHRLTVVDGVMAPPMAERTMKLPIDDHPGAAAAARRLLVALGLEATACENVVDALAAIEAAAARGRPVAAVLLAAHRPLLDCEAALDALRNVAPGVPVVLTTTHQLRATGRRRNAPSRRSCGH